MIALQFSAAGASCKQALPLRHRARRSSTLVLAGPSGDLSREQQEAALKRQLKRSSEKAPEAPAAAASSPAAGVDDLAQRQAAARAWITPWLEGRARAQSQAAQAQIRERVSLMSTDEEQNALKRLLYGGEAAGNKAAAPAAAAAAAPAAAAAAVEESKTQPKAFEDGSLLFTADMLQAVSYEDVLTA